MKRNNLIFYGIPNEAREKEHALIGKVGHKNGKKKTRRAIFDQLILNFMDYITLIFDNLI